MANVRRRSSNSEIRNRLIIGGLKGIHAWAWLVSQRAQHYAPVAQHHLSPSIHPGLPHVEDEAVFNNKVGTNVEYARAHEYGSGIHALNPADRELILIEAGYWTGKSDKKALSFHWPGGPKDLPNYDPKRDKFVFTRVWHPGVPAANQGEGFLRKAMKESAKEGRKLFLDAVFAEFPKTAHHLGSLLED